VDVDERWQQYWHENGQQLVWNDWLQKYLEYNGSYVDASTDVVARETVARTCQPDVNTDCIRNENEVPASSTDADDSKNTVLFASGETCNLVSTDIECSLLTDCENCVEAEESAIDSSGNSVNVTNTQNDDINGLAVDVLKHSSADDVCSDEMITTDRDEVPDGADRNSSWDCLWEQHYAETYWYYYDWFMQWLSEEREMLQCDGQTEQTTEDDVQQSAAESCHSRDDLLPSSHCTDVATSHSRDDLLPSSHCTDVATSHSRDDLLPSSHCTDVATSHSHDDLLPSSHCTDVAMSQESMNIIESLISELLLTVVDSVNDCCLVDGNDRKPRKNKKKEKQREHGLFGVFHLSLSYWLLTLVVMISCDI